MAQIFRKCLFFFPSEYVYLSFIGKAVDILMESTFVNILLDLIYLLSFDEE